MIFIQNVAYRGNKFFIADTTSLYAAPCNGLSTNLQAGDLVEIADLPVGGHSSRTVIAAPAIIGPDGRFNFTIDGGDVQGLFRLVQLAAMGNAAITPVLNLLTDG